MWRNTQVKKEPIVLKTNEIKFYFVRFEVINKLKQKIYECLYFDITKKRRKSDSKLIPHFWYNKKMYLKHFDLNFKII